MMQLDAKPIGLGFPEVDGATAHRVVCSLFQWLAVIDEDSVELLARFLLDVLQSRLPERPSYFLRAVRRLVAPFDYGAISGQEETEVDENRNSRHFPSS
jgi:hypothetical protein